MPPMRFRMKAEIGRTRDDYESVVGDLNNDNEKLHAQIESASFSEDPQDV